MSSLLDLSFTRMSGAGNTFFIATTRDGQPSERAQTAFRLCNDYVGFQTDGVLFLQLENQGPIQATWDFYNSDGSAAEMCGNAARCAGFYYYSRIQAIQQVNFQTLGGVIKTQVIDFSKQQPELAVVQVEMPKIKGSFGPKEVKVNGRKIRGFSVNSGVPHFVLQSEPDLDLARALRGHVDFGPAGANVTFVEMDSSDFLQAVTFERGVEDFTLSCGTGAVAAAFFHNQCYPEIKAQAVEMPGGLMQVEWKNQSVYLTGPAEFHFDLKAFKDG